MPSHHCPARGIRYGHGQRHSDGAGIGGNITISGGTVTTVAIPAMPNNIPKYFGQPEEPGNEALRNGRSTKKLVEKCAETNFLLVMDMQDDLFFGNVLQQKRRAATGGDENQVRYRTFNPTW
jgi:hypothetical protein